MNERDVIDMLADVRKQIAHPLTALAILLETEGRRKEPVLRVPQRLSINDIGTLTLTLGELRLLVKCIYL